MVPPQQNRLLPILVSLVFAALLLVAFKSCRETPIKAASLGNDAGIYGAVRLIVGE